MLGVPLSNHPEPVPGVEGLFALNIDPEAAADDYRKRVVTPYQAIWSEARVAELREQLAGVCTTEVAAFDEFAGLLAGDETSSGYDHVLFDTAPTGHTLRLLSLPRVWAGFLESTTQGASCLGPHSGLKLQEARFKEALAALDDGRRTTLVLVTRPDRAALREADRTAGELETLDIRNQQLVVNAVFEATNRTDAVALALERRGQEALRDMPPRLRNLPTLRIPLRPFNMVGLAPLRALLDDQAASLLARAIPPLVRPTLPRLDSLIEEIAAPGRGLVMVMGKGGVGKTTIAAAIAADLASRGLRVHLSTTDPAAHVSATLAGDVPNLRVSRIDPAAETKAYVDRMMAVRGASLDDAGRAMLAEDFRSPCYEEVAVFAAFARIIGEARTSFVVLDTAPTGHTLLLLDATGSYHRQIARGDGSPRSGRVVTPLMRLRDPLYTKILIVTLAETTPVSEAAALQADLRRAEIEPFAWVVNGSLAASGSEDPCLQQRVAGELEQIARVREQHAQRLAVVPWTPEEPVGVARLRALAIAAL
jgi:arsenite-transporting ATPase